MSSFLPRMFYSFENWRNKKADSLESEKNLSSSTKCTPNLSRALEQVN